MLARYVNDIEKKVERHIELAKLLTEKNQDLSAKIVGLEVALGERDKEILAERQNVETHLKTIKNQSAAMEELKNRCEKLEKDMEQVKLTALETRNSSAVSDFSSAISINTMKMEQFEIARTRQYVRTKELKDRCEMLENNMEQMRKTAEETKNRAVVRDFSSAMLTNSKLLNQLEMEQDQLREKMKMEKEVNVKMSSDHTQLIEQLREFLQTEMLKEQEQKSSSIYENFKSVMGKQIVDSRNIQLITKIERILNCQDGNNSGKYVFVSKHDLSFLLSENVEYIDYSEKNLGSLVHNVSSYKKELLIRTFWESMNTTSGHAEYYAKLLSLCQEWKRLRPDGEIHCLSYYWKGESPSEPSKELVSLLTTCNKCLTLRNDFSLDIFAFRQYWPEFVYSILSEETKKKYPK